ncbi:MAG: MBL fold metallo-hydrolase [Actinobacteria bacterium]|nr:MBL fold metallo-hydrolase [Actinomycetota bacterium]
MTTTSAPVEIAAGVYRVPSQLGVRRIAQWLVLGDEGVILIDSGVAGTVREQILPALAALGRSPEEIVEVAISHADVDHYGGNAELRELAPQARIRCGAADRPLIESWQRIGSERYGWYPQHGLAYDEATLRWLRDAAGPDTELDGVLGEGEEIGAGGATLRVLELPGHTPGHIGFAVEDTVIVVDALLESGLYNVDGERISPPIYVTAGGYRSSIEKVRALAPARLETAHFPDVTGEDVAEFLDLSAAFVADLDRIVIEQLAQGACTVAEMTEAAAAELGPFPEMGIELGRSVGAHLDDLVEVGQARQVEGAEKPTWEADA